MAPNFGSLMKQKILLQLRKAFEYIWMRPWLTIVILAVPTLFFGYFLLQLKIDLRQQAMFNPDDSVLRYYEEEYLGEFGGLDHIALGVEAPHIFDREVLSTIDSITQKVREFPAVEAVISLTHPGFPVASGEEIELFSLEGRTSGLSPKEVASIRSKVLSSQLFKRTLLISEDEQLSIVWAYINPKSLQVKERLQLARDFRQVLRGSCFGTTRCYTSSTIAIELLLHEVFKKDVLTVIPLLLFLLVVTIYLLFRSWRIVVVSLLVVTLGTIWSMGFSSLVSYKVTLFSQALLVIFLIYGAMDILHLISHYRMLIKTTPKKEAIAITLREVGPPCILNTLTAFLGIVSLGAADLAAIQQFGVVAAFGMAVLLLITFILWVYALGGESESQEVSSFRMEGWLSERLMGRLAEWPIRFPMAIFSLAIIVMGFFMWGITKLEADTHADRLFPEESEWVQALHTVDLHQGGWVPTWLVLDTGKPEGLMDAEVLKDIDRVEEYLEELPEVGNTFSIVDAIKGTHQAFQGGDISEYRLPDSNPGRLLALTEGSPYSRLVVNNDLSKANIWTSLRFMPSGETDTVLKKISGEVPSLLKTPMTVQMTGGSVIDIHLVHLLLTGQIKSFTVAFVLICVVMLFVLRSFSLGILSLIPNLFPIVITLGLMGWLGIALDVGTAMIASILFGIVIDDTVHYVFRWRREIEEGVSYEDAIRNTLQVVGRPILFTALVLTVGFSVLGFSGYLPVARFGLLSSFAVIAALLGDLFVLPASLILFRPLQRKKKDQIRVFEKEWEIEPLSNWLTRGSQAPHIYLRVALNLILVIFVVSFSVLEVISVPLKPILVTALVQFSLSGVYFFLARYDRLATAMTVLAMVVDVVMISVLIDLFNVAAFPSLLLIYSIVVVYAGLILDVWGGILLGVWSLLGYMGSVHFSGVQIGALHFWLMGGSMVFLGYGAGFLGTQFKKRSLELASAYRALGSAKQDVEKQAKELVQTHGELKQAQVKLKDYAKNLEEKVEEQTQMLIQQEKMAALGQLSAGLAHEVNNPLNTIGLSVMALRDRLESSNLPSKEKAEDLKILDLAREGVIRAAEVTESLGKFAYSGMTAIVDYDVHEGLDATLRLLEHQLKGRIRIHKEYCADGWLQARGGEPNQIWMNLLTNAISAMNKEGDIWIRTERGEKLFSVSIKDTGCGIPKENLSQLFNPFFTTKPPGQGIGLGLSITYRIVERHQGKIEVESEVQKGSEFKVILPLHLEVSDENDKKEENEVVL
ncbi:MAG: MMPL family transporter [Deltaproteobacteria bacterium]|nr:MMPL family transporter [Deltaproteobacteria bacterium]